MRTKRMGKVVVGLLTMCENAVAIHVKPASGEIEAHDAHTLCTTVRL